MRIVVFGGSGFIGTRLVKRLLDAGHDVTVADIARSEAYPNLTRICNIREAGAVRDTCRGADVIYNLAAVHRDDVRPRSLYRDINVGGASNVCDAASALNVNNIIFTSSVAIYGFSLQELGEDAKPACFNDYGVTKLEAERVYKAWFDQEPGRSLAIVRPTVVFGEGNRGNVFTLIDQINRNRFVMVGNGETIKSIAYVENVAAFLEHVLQFLQGCHVYNYTDKPDYNMRDFVHAIRQQLGKEEDPLRMPYSLAWLIGAGCDMIARAFKKKLPLSRIRVCKFCSPSRYSSTRALATGFTPPVTLPAALQRTIKHDFPRDKDGANCGVSIKGRRI